MSDVEGANPTALRTNYTGKLVITILKLGMTQKYIRPH